MKLSELNVGEKAKITLINGNKSIKRRIMDIGLIPGTVVELIKYAPLGDPIQISAKDFDVIIRKEDANYIEIIKEN
ncbi:MAG: ferrous iron transport protein A [Candidatus Improbicoccus pseudotrichonymphae]|uniref:Ferrous iron transport protein A n=1 Tax=Candidatus Improbicoccus pseudotrichonymphae TaxID=3033792 RepID=A0AA48I2H8_9FIRM|nr:MAG: ferrous iron transport protein A [Candidatus Improbicoccus pseudotrichonymphae]